MRVKKCICVVFMAVSAAAFAGDAKKELNPKFPVVGGTMKVTNEWSLELPEKFNRRFEDGSMVIWRPEFTIWISVWENENRKSPYDQLDYIRSDKSKDAFDITEMKSADIYRYSYRIDEYREEAKKTVYAFYGYVAGKSGYTQIAFYYDKQADLDEAKKIWLSIKEL